MTHKKKTTRRRVRPNSAILRVLTAFAVLAGMMSLFTTTSSATTLSATFELDGNPEESGTTGEDWEDLIGAAGETIATTDIPIFDGIEAPDDTAWWKGGGSKDVNDMNRWAYSATDVAPDKDEIVNAAAAAYRVADGPDSNSDPDLVIAFHADRYSNDGDAAAGFWFFKNPVALTGGKFTAPGGTAAVTHSEGDTLVVSDFNEGEGVNIIRVFTWSNGGLVEVANPGGSSLAKDCQATSHNPYLCATENSGPEDALWDYTPKANVGTDGEYPSYTFLEGAINMSAVLPGANECFASFLAETRSSTSPTAQLKDLVLGDFPICAPSTELSASPTVDDPEIAVVGDDVTFSWTETNDGNVPLTNVYVLTDDDACNTDMTPEPVATLVSGDSVEFSCTITTGADPEIIEIVGTGHGTDTIDRDTTFCAEGTSPEDTVCDPDEQATASAVTIHPGTELSASSDLDTVKEGDLVTFTILESNDGEAPTGYESYLDLTSVRVSTAGSATADTCNAELDSPTGDDGDGILNYGETWTYQCTVPAPSDDFTLLFDGSGIALEGTDHEKLVDFDYDSEEQDSVDVTVISPSTVLTITADAVITYTFVETNDSGDAPLTPPEPDVRESVLGVDTGSCDVSGPDYSGGDDGDDKILGIGESWTFTCVGSLAGPGLTADTGSTSWTLTGIGSGDDATGNPVTYPDDLDERDSVKVEITHNARG